MLRHLHNFFIPHAGNDHRPHALRPRALKWYVALLVGVKVIAVTLLFSSYPDFARLSGDIAEEVVRMVNASRAQLALSPLILDPALTRAAELKAQDMLGRGYFEHVSPDGKMPWEWITTQSYRFQSMGENLAMDFTTGESAHLALMRSDTHRTNILEKRYQNIGIGVATGNFAGRETNILVEFFAAPSTARTAAAASAVPPVSAKPALPVPAEAPSSAVASAPVPSPVEVLPIRFEAADAPAAPAAAAVMPAPAQTPAADTPVSFVVPAQDAQAPSSPSSASVTVAPLTLSFLNGEIRQQASALAFLSRMAMWSQRIFYAALVYLVLTLLVNVFVKIRIQRAPLIAQTITVILLVGGLAALDVHTVETLTDAVKIL